VIEPFFQATSNCIINSDFLAWKKQFFETIYGYCTITTWSYSLVGLLLKVSMFFSFLVFGLFTHRFLYVYRHLWLITHRSWWLKRLCRSSQVFFHEDIYLYGHFSLLLFFLNTLGGQVLGGGSTCILKGGFFWQARNKFNYKLPEINRR